MSPSELQYHLSPDQQTLLVAALASNRLSSSNKASANDRTSKPSDKEKNDEHSAKQNGYQNNTNGHSNQSAQNTLTSGLYPEPDDCPFGFDLDVDVDDKFDFDSSGQFIDDFPGDVSQIDAGDLHEKRKSIGDKDDEEEGGGKRRESEGGPGKKPGRKPLTAEPTTKRKAQNRAAQRAFRERKERHLKDLETKVEDLEKASETTNNENGLLRAQVERLQVKLEEYRKRLSWIGSSGQGVSPSLGSGAPGAAARNSLNSNHNDFQFEFPRFGDPPTNNLPNKATSADKANNRSLQLATLPSEPSSFGVPGIVGRTSRTSLPSSSPQMPGPSHRSTGNSPTSASNLSPSVPNIQSYASASSLDSFSGLFSPSILEASRQASTGYFTQNNSNHSNQVSRNNSDQHISPVANVRQYSTSSLTNSNSPASSYESQQNGSSIGTSPEPSLSSPAQKMTDYGLNTINEENQPQIHFGGSFVTPNFDPNSFNWFAQQNGGGFDPVLFGDYREPQDAVASQDFGAFFNDAFPLPELGSPEHNFNEVGPSPAKPDLMAQVEAAQDGKEEHATSEDGSKMIGCNQVWDRLQSMEKFHNGEIDVESLCTDLRSKAHCSEGGAVVHQKDVDNILSSAR
ncbi:hypothetical protein EPUS_04235 [Endocarpon pusillum Z07020]|uniref:BZIP domain-containing protein n=1 Tax=Endocarpon pusillum (strain Z07020 / HMAS-L-300199) TaxID=1263415 RepID=U1HQS6_ENDPU|nr:uncharacterized protein EPUS_04235 [Endocarpon pusillum Z07020]ERF72800.1 hypothetical protein EPUS_04235 [Endocarpon pusillum Z07020]